MTSYSGRDGNPGGPGGRRGKIRPATPGGGGQKPPERKCCPTKMAIISVRRRKFRLARRYAVLAVRTVAARVV